MIPILFTAEAEPQALWDVNSVDLQDVNFVDLLASGDTSAARAFSNYGIGTLSDCIECEVTEERNGEYELEMRYPIVGVHYEDLALRCIILAKPNYTDDPQAFRIYSITTPIDGVVTVQARHISYDLSGIPVLPFTASSCSAACAALEDDAAVDHPFTIGTQIGTIADFTADVPASVRSWFGGKEGSLIDVYGGEWAYDNYTCTLKSARGEDRGVVIRYGKNLIDFEQEENCENVWTGVLPYWANEEGTVVKADIIYANGSYDYTRILCLDLSTDFEEEPTEDELTAKAESYIENNDIGVPDVNITLDWVQINALSDRVDLCDTVKIVFEKIGVETSAKCIKTVWDVLKDRYSSIEFGDAKTNIVDSIANLQAETEKAKTSVSAMMLNAIANATALITGNSGGYVILHDSDDDGCPDEILIMDTDDIDTATKVWRWNASGLGYSSSGYDGSYGLAMTIDGEIVADYITTGTLDASQVSVENLDADNITTGTLDASQVSVENLDADNITSGTINAIDISGSTISGGTISGATISGNTINVGGASDARGLLNIYNSSGSVAGYLHNSGITFTSGGSILFNNVTAGSSSSGLVVAQSTSTQYCYVGAIPDSSGNTYGTVHLYGRSSSAVTGLTMALSSLSGISLYDNSASRTVFLANASELYAYGVYASTSSSSANVVVGSSGKLFRSTASSRRYKHDISELKDFDPAVLYEIDAKQYIYNDDYLSENDPNSGKPILGFIAEEVAEAAPWAVQYENGEPEMWNINVMFPAVFQLVKEQHKEIETLKEQITSLEARLSALEARLTDDGR